MRNTLILLGFALMVGACGVQPMDVSDGADAPSVDAFSLDASPIDASVSIDAIEIDAPTATWHPNDDPCAQPGMVCVAGWCPDPANTNPDICPCVRCDSLVDGGM